MTELLPAGETETPNSPGFWLNQAALAVNAQLDRALAPHGLTSAQWAAVSLIHQGGARTVSELARLLRADVAATWRLLDRLRAKGYVTRDADPHDRRVVLLTLSADARAIYPTWAEAVASAVADALAGIPAGDVDTLVRMLRDIAANDRPVPTTS